MSSWKSRTLLWSSLVALGIVVGTATTHGRAEPMPTADPPQARASTEPAPPAKALLDQVSVAFESAAARVGPSVVPIFAQQVVTDEGGLGRGPDASRDFFGDEFFRRFFGGRQGGERQTVRSMGSGVIVSADGYIITNNHVVQGADKLTVVMEDGKRYPAKLIGTDPQTDVGVIKIDATGLPAATFGDSEAVKVGQWVIAVGNPFQLLHTVTAGIISAKGRSSVGLADYEDFIQTDASINPGNSGGALADLEGRVIGINTAISSPSGGNVGIGFAIPIRMAREVMDQLIRNGKVTRGYLGVTIQGIDENLAKAMDLKDRSGALVAEVTGGGPADKAHLRRGDIVLQFDGKKVDSSTDLRNMVAESEPGSQASLTVLRDGHEIPLSVTLGERPAEPGGRGGPGGSEEGGGHRLGLSLQSLTPALAQQLGYTDVQGVLVADVAAGSPAEDAGLRRGDLILEVDRVAVKTPQELVRAVSHVRSGDSAALLVRRGDGTFFVAIQVP
jgi:serine protease Do